MIYIKMFRTNLNKLLINIIGVFKSKPIELNLGRWRLENCNKRVEKKIDFANEDHCGPCGNNLLIKK